MFDPKKCSFCVRPSSEVGKLVEGPPPTPDATTGPLICLECVKNVVMVLEGNKPQTQQYIQERNSDEYQSKLGRLLRAGGRVITAGVNLEKADYQYSGTTCKNIHYTNVYWAVVELNCTKS